MGDMKNQQRQIKIVCKDLFHASKNQLKTLSVLSLYTITKKVCDAPWLVRLNHFFMHEINLHRQSQCSGKCVWCCDVFCC